MISAELLRNAEEAEIRQFIRSVLFVRTADMSTDVCRLTGSPEFQL